MRTHAGEERPSENTLENIFENRPLAVAVDNFQ